MMYTELMQFDIEFDFKILCKYFKNIDIGIT